MLPTQIAGLRDSLENTENTQDSENIDIPAPSGPELLVGGVGRASKSEILATIPPQYIVGLLVARFFRSQEFCSTIHVPTFKREVRPPPLRLYHWTLTIFSTKNFG